MCSYCSSIFRTKESLCGHQQKALYYWWGGLRVQLQTCLGRSVEWLEPWWAKQAEKCSLVRLQIRSQQGGVGVDRCRFHGGKTKDWTEKVQPKRRARLLIVCRKQRWIKCTLICSALWNDQLCFPLLRQGLVNPFGLQHNDNTLWMKRGLPLARAAANQS